MPLESSPISPVDDTGDLFVDLFNNFATIFTGGKWEELMWEREIGD